ncbi:MAG: retropepsin-like domain-containing protein [Defluviitaleaceae bacterium]|nr:retropepsin-like domain-containing protein [Defluviitaleaceae bacterium]
MQIDKTYTNKSKITYCDNVPSISIMIIDHSRIPAKPLELVIDTGAFITVIRKETAERLGLRVVDMRGCLISGFSERGMVCDLRLIPTMVFCGFRINDVLVATPHDDGINVTEVLGMNILENFSFGMDFGSEEIFAGVRGEFISQKPRYKCGEISVFRDIA